jgi:hypothetical protein
MFHHFVAVSMQVLIMAQSFLISQKGLSRQRQQHFAREAMVTILELMKDYTIPKQFKRICNGPKF